MGCQGGKQTEQKERSVNGPNKRQRRQLPHLYEEENKGKNTRDHSDTEVDTGHGKFRTPPRQRAANDAAKAAAAAAGKNEAGKD